MANTIPSSIADSLIAITRAWVDRAAKLDWKRGGSASWSL